jgi:hypothetical protein
MKKLLLLICTLALVIPAYATNENVNIEILIPFETADGGDDAIGSGAIYGIAFEDDTAYVQLSLNSLPQITVITNLLGTQGVTRLVDPPDWLLASDKTSMTAFYGFTIVGDYLQFADVASDMIWRIHKVTGEVIRYADTNAILAATGGDSVSLPSFNCANPFNGEQVFYESSTDTILTTDGSNTVQVFISKEALEDEFDTASVSGGFDFDPAGNFYFGLRESSIDYSGLHMRDTNGVLSVIFTEADISLVTGGNYPIFGDIFMAPDGLMYFCARLGASGNILRFDPVDPDNTLELFLSDQDLVESVANDANVAQMGWYDGGLCWHRFQRNPVYRALEIPEPCLAVCLVVIIYGMFVRRVTPR